MVAPSPPNTAVSAKKSCWKYSIGRFFSDLECSQTADFYACVGALGRTFTEIETEAFALPL